MFGRNKTVQSQVEHKESRKERKERKRVEKEAEEQRKARFALEEQSFEFSCEYVGGRILYPKKQRTSIYLDEDKLIIPKLDNLTIPYGKITNLDNMDEKRITKTRIFATGLIVGLLWKKKFVYTIVEFNDGLQDQQVILDFDKDAQEVQRIIYARMLNVKRLIEEI
jgi:hypothetical protein